MEIPDMEGGGMRQQRTGATRQTARGTTDGTEVIQLMKRDKLAHSRLIIISSAIILSLLPRYATAQIRFHDSYIPNVKTRGNPPPPATVTRIQGDFNGDGKADYALLGSTSTYVYLSNGDGTFKNIIYNYPNGDVFGSPPSASWAPVVGDFNGDGKTDFAMLGSISVDVFLSNGDGTFAANGSYYPNGWVFGYPPSSSWTPIVGDFNGDGKTDFAMLGSTAAYVFLNNGSPNFTASIYQYPNGETFGIPPRGTWTPIVGDLNGDGKTDFAMLGSVSVDIFLSNGNGTFAANGSYYPNGWVFGYPPSSSWTPIAGDFNGDGKTDFAMLGSTAAYVFLNNGSGTFTSNEYKYPNSDTFGVPPSATWAPIAGDFNGDGKTDFALLGSVSADVFLSNGNGTFTATGSYYSGGWTFGYPPTAKYTLVTGNFDGVHGTDFLFFDQSAYYTFLGNGAGGFTGSMH
jgi:hypothetical protein